MPHTCLVPYFLVIFCLDKNFDHPDVNVVTAAAQEPDSLQLSVPGFHQAGALAVESVEHSVQTDDLLHGLLGRLFKPASVDQVDEAARHDVLAGKIELKMYSSCSMKCTLCTICGNSFQFQLKQSYTKKYFICTKCEKMFILPIFSLSSISITVAWSNILYILHAQNVGNLIPQPSASVSSWAPTCGKVFKP